MVVFGVSVCGVLAFVYWSTVSVIDSQSDATIEAEIAGLEEQYAERGLLGLVELIRARSSDETRRRGLYLLADPLLTPLAGNLTRWPQEAQGDPRWVDFRIQHTKTLGAPPQIARARTFRLRGGFHLLVGRDLTERAEFRETITEALFWALVITIALGLGGGLLLSRNFLRRLDSINQGSRAILHGDLKQRMPVTGSGDEYDQLAQNLNEMLDQIGRLMDGMRGVADDIAHDLRSPISRLRARLELTLMDKPDTDEIPRRAREDDRGGGHHPRDLQRTALDRAGRVRRAAREVRAARSRRPGARRGGPLSSRSGGAGPAPRGRSRRRPGRDG